MGSVLRRIRKNAQANGYPDPFPRHPAHRKALTRDRRIASKLRDARKRAHVRLPQMSRVDRIIGGLIPDDLASKVGVLDRLGLTSRRRRSGARDR